MRDSNSQDRYRLALSVQSRADVDESPYRVVVNRLILCNRCGNISLQKPNNVIGGHGCRHCASNSSKISEANFKKELALTSREDVDALPYSAHGKRRIRCLICCHIQSQIPSSVIQGRGCSECALKNISRLASNRYSRLDLTGKAFGYLVVTGPDRTENRRYWKCKCICGNVTSVSTGDINSNHNRSCGCISSGPEIELIDYIRGLGFVEACKSKSVIKNEAGVPLELDIYVPSKKIAFEYCGLHWHGELRNGKNARSKHIKKLNACMATGIRLITIFEDEWLGRKDIVKDRISSLLGVGLNAVGARKCQVADVTQDEARLFADKYHLQGAAFGTISIGLKFQNEFVAMATFLKSSGKRKGMSVPGVWELVRYTVKAGMSVQGGLGRLLSHFENRISVCTEVVSFSDRRWSMGGLYSACGFILTRTTPPDYRYFKKPDQRLHKFGFRKKILAKRYGFDMSMTETQMAQKAGFDRIWDCGLDRWIWRPPNANSSYVPLP